MLDDGASTDPQNDIVPALTDSDYRCKRGDIWKLGQHTLICGDALQAETYKALMGDARAQMVLTDPPYNVRVSDIGSTGKIKHNEFAMAFGEMTRDEFTEFLTTEFVLLAVVEHTVHSQSITVSNILRFFLISYYFAFGGIFIIKDLNRPFLCGIS